MQEHLKSKQLLYWEISEKKIKFNLTVNLQVKVLWGLRNLKKADTIDI
nr:MAG TPA: hypothetical protein [Crassvirales sp.]